MKLDNRFFNRVILIATLFSIVLITWFTIKDSKKSHQDFITQWMGSSEWNNSYIRLLGSNDSTRIANLPKPLIIYFWSGWSDLSINGLNELSTVKSDTITIIAALVKDTEEAESRLDSVILSKVHLSYGTYIYFNRKVTAVPSYVYINKNGVISDIQIGFKSKEELMELPYFKK